MIFNICQVYIYIIPGDNVAGECCVINCARQEELTFLSIWQKLAPTPESISGGVELGATRSLHVESLAFRFDAFAYT